jgi:putative acetyltransferase
MPEIDFAARLAWWRKRWVDELVPGYSITLAERAGRICGFIVLDRNAGWLDQIVVDPADWGTGVADLLIAEAKRIAPNGVTLDVNQSNGRAARFYERAGFVRTGEGLNAVSGAPTWIYGWKPGST